ncbi:MAG: DUF86 domain-containing protein [Thermoplasmata archaeon]|nr:DUF86 domain-containing protein [Thermoplasmata archaeon]
MLREADAASRYAARGKALFFDLRYPELRDAVELRILHFTETATKLGSSFREANPRLPWESLGAVRNDLVHEYAEIKAEKVWRFVREDLPGLVAKLRRARFSRDDVAEGRAPRPD